jgi:hypothetical protein
MIYVSSIAKIDRSVSAKATRNNLMFAPGEDKGLSVTETGSRNERKRAALADAALSAGGDAAY